MTATDRPRRRCARGTDPCPVAATSVSSVDCFRRFSTDRRTGLDPSRNVVMCSRDSQRSRVAARPGVLGGIHEPDLRRRARRADRVARRGAAHRGAGRGRRPAARRRGGAPAGGTGRRRARPAQPHRCRAAGHRPRRRRRGAGRAGLRVRRAAALPRRPDRGGDLDQRPVAGVRRPRRPARADPDAAQRDAGPGARRADAEVQRSAHRPLAAVRRRDAARGAPAARRARGHQPRLLGGEHPQVRRTRRAAARPRRRSAA